MFPFDDVIMTQETIAVNFSFQGFIYSHSFANLNDIDFKFSLVVDNIINVWAAKLWWLIMKNEWTITYEKYFW